MRKRVAILYSGGKYWGGIETLELNLFRYYDKKKTELIFFSLGEWPLTEALKKEGAKVVVFPKARISIATIFKMAKTAKKMDIKLLVSGGLVADSYARATSLVSGVPHLSMIHSSFNNDYPDKLRRTIYGLLVAVSAWKTKHYIAVSEYLKEELVKKGIKSQKISVIYNGVTLAKSEKRKEKKGGGKVVITSVGRLHPVKGYDLLIPAMVNVPNAELLIFGEGEEKENLQALIDKLGLTNKVKLMGYAKDTMDVYEKTDIYVQPSLSEGFGLGVVEAMLFGLPIVVTPCGSMLEIIKNGENGLLAKSVTSKAIADSLNKLVADSELREKLARAAKEYAQENFEIKSWAKKITEAFLTVASNKGGQK